jgi:hypothetical protein
MQTKSVPIGWRLAVLGLLPVFLVVVTPGCGPGEGTPDAGDADVPGDADSDALDGDAAADAELDGDPDVEVEGPSVLGVPCDGDPGPCPAIPAEGEVLVEHCCLLDGEDVELRDGVWLTIADGGELRMNGSHLGLRGDATVNDGGRLVVDECSEVVFLDDPNAGPAQRNSARHRRVLVERGGFLRVGAPEDVEPESVRGAICAFNESAVVDPPVDVCGGELRCLSLAVDPPACGSDPDLPGSCGPPEVNPLDELRYFELAVEGSLELNGAHVAFVGVHRDDDGSARWCASGNTDTWWVEQPVLSGIQVHPRASAHIRSSTVAYSEAFGVYILEDYSGAPAEEVADRISSGERMLDVSLEDTDIHHAGLGVWCHPYVGADGIVLTDVPTAGERFHRCPVINRCPHCQWTAANIAECAECGTRGCDPEAACSQVEEFHLSEYPPPWDPDSCGGYVASTMWNEYNNPAMDDRTDRLPRPLQDVLSECVGLHPDDSRLQQICEEEHLHQSLHLNIHGCTIHDNARGGIRLQSLYTVPSVVGNDIFANGNECVLSSCADCVVVDVDGCHSELPAACAACSADRCRGLDETDPCFQCCRCGRCLFALGDECRSSAAGDSDLCTDGSGEHAPVTAELCEFLFPYDPETRADALTSAEGNDVVRYRAALPSSSRHGSYGILGFFHISGELRHNDIHRHTGYGLIHSKAASWIIEYNRFWHNMVAFGSG